MQEAVNRILFSLIQCGSQFLHENIENFGFEQVYESVLIDILIEKNGQNPDRKVVGVDVRTLKPIHMQLYTFRQRVDGYAGRN